MMNSRRRITFTILSTASETLRFPRRREKPKRPNQDKPEPLKIKEWNLFIIKLMEPQKDTEKHGKNLGRFAKKQ